MSDANTSYPIDFDRDLVLEFFLEFSRFEYALKRRGFLVPGRRDAVPDWKGYGRSLGGTLSACTDSSFVEAYRLLKQNPPKKQIINSSGQLDWEAVLPGDDPKDGYLLGLVKTIRNNLFHGGKYPYPIGPVEDTARDRYLIQAALVVLRASRRLSPELDSLFQEAA